MSVWFTLAVGDGDNIHRHNLREVNEVMLQSIARPGSRPPCQERLLVDPWEGKLHDFAPGRPNFLADPLPRFCVPGLNRRLSTNC